MSADTGKSISDHSEPPEDVSSLDGVLLPAVAHGGPADQGIVRPTDEGDRRTLASGERAVAFSSFEHGYLWSNILFAEQKAGFIFAADAAFIGYLTANDILKRIFSNPSGWGIKGYIAVVALASLGLSAACVIRVVMPRTAGRYSGLIFWGAVAGHASARLYVDNVTKLHESEFTLEILQHCHELARIARAKYKGLRFSIIFGLLGFVAGLAYTRIP